MHLERQTHWFLGLLIYFKLSLCNQNLFSGHGKLYMPVHLHVSVTILRNIDWLKITGNIFQSPLNDCPCLCPVLLNSLPLWSSSDTSYISLLFRSTQENIQIHILVNPLINEPLIYDQPIKPPASFLYFFHPSFFGIISGSYQFLPELQ